MFQEEYKKKYDNLHPSAELIEKTKKRALEKCKEQPEDVELEAYDPWNENDSKLSKHNKWIRIAGGMAAGIAIVATGVYLGNSLQPKSEKEQHVAKSVETPLGTVAPEETTKGKKKETKDAKKHQVQKKESIETNASSDAITKLAQMGRGTITVDYASENRVIFHGDFGIIIYSISEGRIVETISSSQYDEDGVGAHIQVNADGTKILFSVYNEEILTDDVKLYEVGSGQTKSVEPEDSVWEEEMFGQLQSVAGTEADVYTSCTGTMVALGNNRYLQLMYQVPASYLQASLTVSIVDLNAKTEQLYSVFGSTGKSIEEKQGRSYGNYHNERGMALFATAVEEEPKEDETEVTETLLPEETEGVEEPIVTQEVEQTMAPIVEETEVPQELLDKK